jgi:hypothetical protein
LIECLNAENIFETSLDNGSAVALLFMRQRPYNLATCTQRLTSIMAHAEYEWLSWVENQHGMNIQHNFSGEQVKLGSLLSVVSEFVLQLVNSLHTKWMDVGLMVTKIAATLQTATK